MCLALHNLTTRSPLPLAPLPDCSGIAMFGQRCNLTAYRQNVISWHKRTHEIEEVRKSRETKRQKKIAQYRIRTDETLVICVSRMREASQLETYALTTRPTGLFVIGPLKFANSQPMNHESSFLRIQKTSLMDCDATGRLDDPCACDRHLLTKHSPWLMLILPGDEHGAPTSRQHSIANSIVTILLCSPCLLDCIAVIRIELRHPELGIPLTRS